MGRSISFSEAMARGHGRPLFPLNFCNYINIQYVMALPGQKGYFLIAL